MDLTVPSPINFLLRVPRRVEAQARYTLGVLSDTIGVPFRLLDVPGHDRIDVVYTDTEEPRIGKLWLPCDVSSYETDQKYTHHMFGETRVWGAPSATAATWDLIGSTFRLLSLIDENGVPEKCRDRRGVFTVAGLPSDRKQVCAETLVENQASILRQKMRPIYARLDELSVPLWPNGKKYALLLTHDTDAVAIGSSLEMLYNLTKGVLRRDWTYLRMFKDGFIYLGQSHHNPLFGFPKWREIEDSRLRSCFYLFARWSKLRWDINDCRSSVVEQDIDWNVLRSMADDGWEFGLHAPIYAKENIDGFIWGKQFIEERLGRRIVGLRHHYWALDWRRPYLTFRMHQDAGFRYDTSIAWRDKAGFRAGTCLPYLPFDLERKAALNLWEIPTCLMDGHIFNSGKPIEQAMAEAVSLIRQIEQSGGVVMLNWHTETACNDYCYADYVTRLLELLTHALDDSAAWVTTPRELIRHWDERHQMIQKSLQC